ncbi:MAG: lysophospholipid acyltransferase family protein [Thermodesulfobacteriota bacterium]
MAVSQGIGQRLALWLVPRLYGMLSRLLFATCRLTVVGDGYRRQCEAAASPFVAAFWHYGVFCIIELHRDRGQGWAAMVSASGDAEYVARMLERKGLATVRGSRNRSGVRALKGLIDLMRQGLSAAIVADGSQGPARVMQAGALLLASKSGAPILPVAVAADRYWAFRSWDRTILPKPFARLVLCYGEPLAVAADAGGEAIEAARLELEQRLNRLYAAAWREAGRPPHDGQRDVSP